MGPLPVDPAHVRYQLSEQTLFRVAPSGELLGQIFGAAFRLTPGFHTLFLEFSTPSSIAEVHERVDSGMSLEALVELLDFAVSRGILRVAESAQSEASLPRLADYLSPAFLHFLEQPGAAQARFAQGNACFVEDAFRRDFADAVHEALRTATNWLPYEARRAYSNGQSRFLALDLKAWPEPVRIFRLVLDQLETKGLLSALSGADCAGPVMVNPNAYFPGDFGDPHDDGDPRIRSVAFIWYLAPDWNPAWGGNFHWAPSRTAVTPRFNTFAMFKVSERSTHFVSPVTAEAPPRRLSIPGWFTPDTRKTFVDENVFRDEGWFEGKSLHAIAPDVFTTSRK